MRCDDAVLVCAHPDSCLHLANRCLPLRVRGTQRLAGSVLRGRPRDSRDGESTGFSPAAQHVGRRRPRLPWTRPAQIPRGSKLTAFAIRSGSELPDRGALGRVPGRGIKSCRFSNPSAQDSVEPAATPIGTSGLAPLSRTELDPHVPLTHIRSRGCAVLSWCVVKQHCTPPVVSFAGEPLAVCVQRRGSSRTRSSVTGD